MSTHRHAPVRRVMAAAVLLVALAACSDSADGDGDAIPDGAGASASPEASDGGPAPAGGADGDVQPSDAPSVDYDDDAGADLVVHEYPDDPEPAEESAGTLCNLTGQYVQSLRTVTDDGVPVVDDDLRLSVLSMSDNLLLWDSMRSHFPEYAEAIDDAQQVRDLWDEALLNTENGDEAAAQRAMVAAEEALEELPEVNASDAIDCD